MSEGMTADQLFDALADVHRRRLLLALIDHNPQDVSALPGVPWTVSESETVLTSKRHVHLPKLADYGLIEWDRDEQMVTKGPRFDEIEPILELLDDHHDDLPVRMV